MAFGARRIFHVISTILMFSYNLSFLAFCMGRLFAFPGSYVIWSQFMAHGYFAFYALGSVYTDRIGYAFSIRLFGQLTYILSPTIVLMYIVETKLH